MSDDRSVRHGFIELPKALHYQASNKAGNNADNNADNPLSVRIFADKQ